MIVESMVLYLILAAFVALVLVVVIIFMVMKKRRSSVKTGVTKKPLNKGSGTFEGIDYKYQYVGGTQHSPPSFTITLDTDSILTFKVKKESKIDKFFKSNIIFHSFTKFTSTKSC